MLVAVVHQLPSEKNLTRRKLSWGRKGERKRCTVQAKTALLLLHDRARDDFSWVFVEESGVRMECRLLLDGRLLARLLEDLVAPQPLIAPDLHETQFPQAVKGRPEVLNDVMRPVFINL